MAPPSKGPCMHPVLQTLLQASADPRLLQKLLDPPGQVWVRVLVHKVSQSSVSSGSSMVGLMATSSKRTYAQKIPAA